MKLITATALSLAMMTGAALAQATGATPESAGESKDFWEDRANVGMFFTDETMTTLRPAGEFRTVWMDMTPENQAAMRAECEANENRGTNAEAICSQIMTF